MLYNLQVDLSGSLSHVFNFVASAIGQLLEMLNSIYILPHVSVLTLLVALAILGMIISAVFVLFDGGVEDD